MNKAIKTVVIATCAAAMFGIAGCGNETKDEAKAPSETKSSNVSIAQKTACISMQKTIQAACEAYLVMHPEAMAGGSIALTDLYKADGTGYLKKEPKCPDGASGYSVSVDKNNIVVKCSNADHN